MPAIKMLLEFETHPLKLLFSTGKEKLYFFGNTVGYIKK
jgi:hypothetical protein